ncbi:hypothetical protein TorRG33x02_322630 [Trema orientale]|uniref:UBE2O-like tandem tSH3-B domain-containing protein n=1 Tax=Trema orientale TaxID=63057 RepID=A0A2P5BFZ6_TREOI|nr:hypothetical protein TorRG33x02_322630 [Trema orientale]
MQPVMSQPNGPCELYTTHPGVVVETSLSRHIFEMGSGQSISAHEANEAATGTQNYNCLDHNDSLTDPNTCSERKEVKTIAEVVNNANTIPYIYRQYVVRKETGMVGVVTEVAGDSDSDSSITDDEDDEDEDDSDDDEDNGENEGEMGDEGSNLNGGVVIGIGMEAIVRVVHFLLTSFEYFGWVGVPYYPGQHVRASSSSVFKNSTWLSGLWKASRLEGTVTEASAGYGPDSSTAPAEEQSQKNLKLLSCFAHANWHLCDRCLVSLSTSSSSSVPLEKCMSKLELHDSINSELDSTQMGSACDSETSAPEESNGNNGSMDLDVVAELVIMMILLLNSMWWRRPLMTLKIYACEARRVGVVRSANAKEKTACCLCIKWLKPVFRPEDPREFDKEEVIMIIAVAMSLLDRLSPVSISAEAAPDRDFIKEPKQQNGRNEVEEGQENCSGHEKVDDKFTDNTCVKISQISPVYISRIFVFIVQPLCYLFTVVAS